MRKELIADISTRVAFSGRRGGTLWFHPRACRLPGSPQPDPPSPDCPLPVRPSPILMTAQEISASDYFHPVHWMVTSDGGDSWSAPTPVPGFGRSPYGGSTEEAVCDVVPEYHPQSGKVLAMGHNVFYRDGGFFKPQPARWPVYNVFDPARARWGKKRRLEWDGREADRIYTCGCAQRFTFDTGEILIPLSYGDFIREDRRVCTVVAEFDGEKLGIVKTGPALELAVGRGLLEPSIVRHDGRFYMTIRAEDNLGHVSTSSDGLNWSKLESWTWDDGEPLTMSTTQQRWIAHSDGLFLVYTRKDEPNAEVMRWRAPLFIAEVTPDRPALIKESERIVVPMRGDGAAKPVEVPRLGNFHTVNVSPDQSWVTVGENIPPERWAGDTIIGTITWMNPNLLVQG